MNGLQGPVPTAGQLLVRALYDYQADDTTSLSFRQGDIIQVITQLESGWWDGVIHGVRGWFPSNYCSVMSSPYDDANGLHGGLEMDNEELDDEFADHDLQQSLNNHIAAGNFHPNGTGTGQEEAAFWIPQATPDGRLFYFNTLTGDSRMELPLEAPTSADESGPQDRATILVPDQTRPPPELVNAGYDRDEDYVSDMDDLGGHSSQRRFQDASPVSPIVPSNDFSNAMLTLTRTQSNNTTTNSFSALRQGIPPIGTTMSSFANAPAGAVQPASLPRRFFDDSQAVPLTWNNLVEDMRRAVQRYREVLTNRDRSEYVRKAEDISDHLRLLLAAGSGTTDNHSGNPSIISTNKALYPHFRDMMSRFSKLVLSSHIAAADFPAPDSVQKCLGEAEGVLQGVYGFVEVARQQRGEEIPRITPGFVAGSTGAGHWQSNGLSPKEAVDTMTFMDEELESFTEPTAYLDQSLLARMEDLKRLVASGIRRLDEHLTLREHLITPQKHRKIGDSICKAGGQVIEMCRPYLSTVESINLAPLGTTFSSPQLNDFVEHKQRLYDSASDLIMACQAVTAPLADEWAEVRGSSLEDRMYRVRSVGRDLDNAASQILFSLQMLSELMPASGTPQLGGNSPTFRQHVRNASRTSNPGGAPTNADHARTLSAASQATNDIQRNVENSKVQRFFGEVPAPPRGVEEIPEYLMLDHEGEIAYDVKVDPPQLRGGTLTALVEQLTRHDRLDSSFNNTFLLTYKSFTSAPELFDLLVKRWTIQPPPGLAGADLQTWVDKKQKPIRFRVVNILKSWFDNYWLEGTDEASQQLMQKVYNFAKDTVQSTSTPGAGPLMTSIEQRMRGQDASSKRMVPTQTGQMPAAIVPKSMKKLKFLDIDALEFARQLTLIEAKLYGKIKATECLKKTWQKKLEPGEVDPASNVKALILHSNQLTNWVAQMILTQGVVRGRVSVIKAFVSVADKCRTLNNFSCITSIISALASAPVNRLGRTWAQIPPKTSQTLESLRKLMASTRNFLEYREALHKANPPCIPFFGIYLTDLTFIEDGIPSVIKKTQLINFAKRSKTAEVIRDIQQYQNVPYGLQEVPELQEYITRNMKAAGDVHEMYDKSLQVEPREREDEKIAR